MSVEVTFPIWKWSKQKGARLLLLVAIGDYANAEGIAWPSIASLCKRTRMSERYVQKMLREIEEDGELEIVKRTNTSNVYRVRIQQPPADQLPGELQFTPAPQPRAPGGDPGCAVGVIPAAPNPSGEPLLIGSPSSADAIYEVYPRKVAKSSALKAIAKVVALHGHDKIFAATSAYRDAVAGWPDAEKCFIPHPATWFNRGSYEDDPANWKRHVPSQNTHRSASGRSFAQAGDYSAVANH